MNEDTISEYYIPKPSSWLTDIEGHKKLNESLKLVWAEHRRIDEERRLASEKNK